MPSQAEVIEALRRNSLGSPSLGVPEAVGALSGQQHMAGDVLNPSPMTFIGQTPSVTRSYDNMLQQPSGAAAIRSMGGSQAAPPNVLPISPGVKQQMGSTPLAGAQFAENDQPAWAGMPLRTPVGQFTSPQGPLQVTGPAMYRNAMRLLDIKPTEYNKK
jgi:hypothetical protein